MSDIDAVLFRNGGGGEMVSRRRILSRSRDDLNLEASYQEEEDDVWYKKEKLYSVSTPSGDWQPGQACSIKVALLAQ